MAGPKILVDEPAAGPKRVRPPEPELGWFLLGWAGWVFLAVGLADISLGWIPANFDSPEWEFATITRSFDSLPVPFLGAALIMGAGVARGRVWWGRVGVIVLLLIAVWVLFSAVLYALIVPVALQAVQQPTVLYGLKKAIFRTGLQILLYAIDASGMAWLGWKQFFARSRARSDL